MTAVTPTTEPVRLDWDDIQGNVLRGYGFDHGRHLVLRVHDREIAQRWLADLIPSVTPATPWTARPDATLNVAFTARGLDAFGLDPAALATFPAEFREGMQARAVDQLGDVGPDDPGRWELHGPHHADAHVLVMVQATESDAADEAAARARNHAAADGLEVIATQHLGNLPTTQDGWSSPRRAEHFGFVDGVSQPAVEGAIEPATVRGNGTALDGGGWRPVRPGEFVLGYPDEEEPEPPLPVPPELVHNGSFLVYRKLAQDVAAFRRVTLEQGRRHGIAPEVVAAKLVGRRADGTSLLDPPERVASHEPLPSLNDMRYADDGAGQVCPIGSHIRRTNPRDALGMKPELVSRHRLLRRGMPFGPPLPPDSAVDDGVPRGLVFMAYCADIGRQFEFTQREWMNDGNVFGVGHTQDPIAGHGDAPRRFAFEVDGRPVLLAGLPRLVRTLGGEYLFQPGLNGLRFLAGNA